MNITKEADEMVGKPFNLHKMELEEAARLLAECSYFLNWCPNKTYNGKLYKESYELASDINKYLKKLGK